MAAADADPASDRRRFYLYCRQRGLWPFAASGVDPRANPSVLAPFCPLRQVTSDFPPTMLLHGDADTDVPFEQTVEMAEVLAGAGVEHALVRIPDGEHVFDRRLDDPVVAAAIDQALSFLARHLQWEERDGA
jgi:dipeptidyl aminopeptidase/acylaminoacyl peptidase